MAMFVLYWALALGCWGYAVRYGGASARWAFGLFLAAMLGTAASTDLVVRQSLGVTWDDVNFPLFLVDLLYFVGLYAIALRSNRYWPIWSAGFQLLCVLTHMGPLIDQSARPKLYRALESVWILPMLLTMVAGIAKDRKHAQRQAAA